MGDNFDLKKFLIENKLTQTNQINEQDEEWSITPNEEEWNKFEVGDILIVDWANEMSPGFAERFQNKPFKITDGYENGGSNYYKVVPADKETKELWNKEMYWDFHYAKKNNVKPYYGELSEQDDDEWTVTPDEKEWNKPEVGSIVTVDIKSFMPEAYQEFYDKYLKQFENDPFKVTNIKDWGGTKLYKLVPVDKETRRQWKKNHDDLIKDTETFRMNTWFFRPTFYYAFENYLKPYSAPINEQDEDDFNVTPDESHWNELEVGDEVLVDWNMVNDFDIEDDMTWFHPMKNKPFKIIDKMKDLFYGNICGIAPVDEKDNDKWDWEVGGVWWVVEKALKPYQGSVNEEQDDEFNVTPDEKHWNQPDIGDIVTVNFKNDARFKLMDYQLYTALQKFNGVPFEIVNEVAYDPELWWIEPYRAEDKVKWTEMYTTLGKQNQRYPLTWNKKGWGVDKNNVETYSKSLNEDNDDEWTVTPDEKEWNQPDIGDIVIVDFEEETDSTHGDVYQFIGVPFKIVREKTRENWSGKVTEWWVEPVRSEDKKKWKEVYNQQTRFGGNFWTGKGWSANKANVKKYIGSISENDDDEFNITPDEKEWNKLGVGDLVTVDWNQVEFDEVFMPFENKPFEIIDEAGIFFGKKGDNWLIFPYKEEDKQKWIEMLKKKSGPRLSYGYWINKKNVKPYTGPINEEEQDDEWTVTPDEKEWNEPGIGDIVTVDWSNYKSYYSKFINKPFKIIEEDSDYYTIILARNKDREELLPGSALLVYRADVRPYILPLDEDVDDDDFNVTPDEKEWNKPDIGSIVKVDFEAETDEHKEIHQFIGVPFEIVGESVKYDSWWVEPYRAEDKAKWKKVKMKWGEENTYYWKDEKWLAFKRNVKPYED